MCKLDKRLRYIPQIWEGDWYYSNATGKRVLLKRMNDSPPNLDDIIKEINLEEKKEFKCPVCNSDLRRAYGVPLFYCHSCFDKKWPTQIGKRNDEPVERQPPLPYYLKDDFNELRAFIEKKDFEDREPYEYERLKKKYGDK